MPKTPISFIIPVFNEEAIIADAVKKNIAVANQFDLDYELIIINDGSTDGSRSIINSLCLNHDCITFLDSPANEGFGKAVMTGIKESTKTNILCVPADSPMTNEVFQKFYDNIGKGDILVSYRLKRIGYTWWMNLNSYVFHFLVSFLFDMNLKDYNWIHLYKREIFEDENAIEIEYSGIFMLAEVLIKAKRGNRSLSEFPVEQTQRVTGIASASKLKNIIKTLKDMFAFRLKLWYSGLRSNIYSRRHL